MQSTCIFQHQFWLKSNYSCRVVACCLNDTFRDQVESKPTHSPRGRSMYETWKMPLCPLVMLQHWGYSDICEEHSKCSTTLQKFMLILQIFHPACARETVSECEEHSFEMRDENPSRVWVQSWEDNQEWIADVWTEEIRYLISIGCITPCSPPLFLWPLPIPLGSFS